MRAGRLNRKVVVQQKTETTDTYGGPVESWADVATVWARVQPIKGREMIAAQAAQSETAVRFYTRYQDNLTTAMRIVYSGKNYDITGIVDIDERHVELEISAKTGTSEG